MFLSPHKILPGGIKGLAILMSHVTEMKLGFILFCINLPFILLKRRSLRVTITALTALIITTGLTLYLHPFPPLVSEPVMASILGGIIFGCGIGFIVRYGWYVDGVNDVAVLLKKKFRLSVSELLMILNLAILACGGFYFGWDQAMHSTIAYYAAYKTIQFTIDYKSRKLIRVHSSEQDRLAEILIREFGSDVVLLSSEGCVDAGLFFTISEKNLKKLGKLLQQHDRTVTVDISQTNHARTDSTYKK